MIKRIAHIGIAVKDLQNAKTVFESLLGLHPSHDQRVEEQKVDVSSFHVDDTNLELTSGTDEESPISKFIETGENAQNDPCKGFYKHDT